MATEELFLRRAVVFGSALLYWAGVFVQARRVRHHIGRSPNVKPRGRKETLLWLGWVLVIAAWLSLPFLTGNNAPSPLLRFVNCALHPAGFAVGLLMLLAGYGGTLWCYAAMGNAWRIGIDRKEKTALVTRGPYRWVRHPIYLFQIVMLLGAALLLPTLLSVVVIAGHLLCALTKAADEECYLLTVHGDAYRDYLARTGRLFPRLRGRPPPSE